MLTTNENGFSMFQSRIFFIWHKEFQFVNFVDPTEAAPRDVLQEMLV